jgi:hypothetical protein
MPVIQIPDLANLSPRENPCAGVIRLPIDGRVFLKDITWRFLGDPLAIPDIGNPLE